MRKRTIICGVAIVALCMTASTLGKAMVSENELINDTQSEEFTEKMRELNELQEEMDVLLEEEGEDEEKIKELSKEIANQELECGVFDYQEEVELRINTVETAINDMKRELERGVSAEISNDINKRIAKLYPVVEKYKNIMGNVETDASDYESIAFQLEEELSAVYEEIN